MKLKKIIKKIDKVLEIRDSNLNWETKYDVIFNMGLWEKMRASGYALMDWYDPDTTYEEDVRAYCEALIHFKEMHSERNS